MPFEKNPDELGALWLHTSARGDYMTGEVAGVKVFCLPVQGKGPKSPAWRVLKSVPKDEKPARSESDDSDIDF